MDILINHIKKEFVVVDQIRKELVKRNPNVFEDNEPDDFSWRSMFSRGIIKQDIENVGIDNYTILDILDWMDIPSWFNENDDLSDYTDVTNVLCEAIRDGIELTHIFD